VRLWDIPKSPLVRELKGTLRRELEGHTDSVTSVAFSPDGGLLASGSADRSILLWDVPAFQQHGPPLTQHEDFVTSLAFTPDSKTLASGSGNGQILLWKPKPGPRLPPFPREVHK